MLRDSRKEETIAWPLLGFILALSPNVHAQTGPLPPWTVLAEESTAVVVADVVEAQMWVISPEKLAKAEVTPDGKPTLPNPSAFVLGILSNVRIKQVIEGDGILKKDETAGVFVYGYDGSDAPHVLMEKEKCVLFLRPMKTLDKDFARAVIVRPGTLGSPEKHARSDPKTCYTPVREGFGQVILRPDRMQVLDEIKQAIAKRP